MTFSPIVLAGFEGHFQEQGKERIKRKEGKVRKGWENPPPLPGLSAEIHFWLRPWLRPRQ